MRRIVVVIALLLFSFSSGFAEGKRATVTGDTAAIRKLLDSPSPLELSTPFHFTISLLGAGRARIILDSLFPIQGLEKTQRIALQGRVRFSGSRDVAPVSAILYSKGKERRLRFTLFSDGANRKQRQRNSVFQIETTLDNRTSRKRSKLARGRRRTKTSSSCGTAHQHSTSPIPHSRAITQRANLKEIGWTIEFDDQFQSRAGDDALTLLAQFVTVTDTILRRDLGLTVQTYINPTPVSYSSEIQPYYYSQPIFNEVFARYPASVREGVVDDIVFVFTGKSQVGEAAVPIGAVPDLGGICGSAYATVGFVRYTEDLGLDLITPAHEIGHILGANHDDNYQQPAVMNATWFWWDLVSEEPSFSDYAQSEIAAVLAQDSSCLAEVSDETPESDVALTLKRNKKKPRKLTVTLRESETNDPVSGTTIAIYCAKGKNADLEVCSTGITNEKGKLKLKGKPKYRYQAQITWNDEEQTSKVVKVPKKK